MLSKCLPHSIFWWQSVPSVTVYRQIVEQQQSFERWHKNKQKNMFSFSTLTVFNCAVAEWVERPCCNQKVSGLLPVKRVEETHE